MNILVFEVTEEKKKECESKFLSKFFAIGGSEGLFNLTFLDADIHTVSDHSLVVHDRNGIAFLDRTDFSSIKIM